MPSKTVPGKNVPTKNPLSRGSEPKSSPTRGVKGGTGKKAKEKQKGRRLKLKGWLETKADWAKFDAWAKINAQPRKIPEPEPVMRASKPLSKMKKRIADLSKPHKHRVGETCRSDLGVSKKALTAKPSKRIIQLAMFVVKNFEPCRESKISPAALRYKATKRILEISRPHGTHISENCKFLTTLQTGEQTNVRAKRLALAKKAMECPNLMTDEEMNILMTSTGIYRSALTYKFTPWMTYLALPSYRFLKPQTHEQAEKWKKFILQENETRGKRALKYKKNKKDEIKHKDEHNEKREKKEDDARNIPEKEATAENIENGDNNKKEDSVPEEESEKPGNDENETAVDTGDNAQASATNGPEKKENEENAADDEATKRRKAERNAWRFAPLPCKDDPFEIKRSALKGKVSSRMVELAKHHVHENKTCRQKPFEVRKSALMGPVPERMSELAKPNHPRDPVERPPPRDKDSFGRPIFPMPPYGKKLATVKPYQEAECPVEAEKTDNESEKKKEQDKKPRFIDPIAYEATIDPCIDPEKAKRQLKVRKTAKEEMEKRKQVDETAAKENVQPET